MPHRVVAAVGLGALLLAGGCTTPQPSTPAPSRSTSVAPQLTGTAEQICTSHFPTATGAVATNYGGALHAGTSGPDVTGQGRYPAESPVVECLVPRGNLYYVEMIVLSDGSVEEIGSQTNGDQVNPRP